jgi:predicted nucleic acid-binding protein
MIFLDANIFVRHLVRPSTSQDQTYQQRAAALFDLVDAGTTEVTTSEATLAEVAYILTSPRHYGTSRETAADGLKALLRPPACRMPSKDMSLLALDIWVDHPKLSFPDALAAAYSMVRGYELATFDAALSRTSGVSNYVFN